jgi:hypothetical protein
VTEDCRAYRTRDEPHGSEKARSSQLERKLLEVAELPTNFSQNPTMCLTDGEIDQSYPLVRRGCPRRWGSHNGLPP